MEPVNEQDWQDLYEAVITTFTPHTPVDEEALFSGRRELLNRLLDVVFQIGAHAVIHGRRGVGKSSLANIVNHRVLARSDRYRVLKRNCTGDHDFAMIWRHVFDDVTFDGVEVSKLLQSGCNPYDVFRIIDTFPPDRRLVLIIDEFDRVRDEATKVAMSDTIKYLSDYGSKATIIVVGVADDLIDLFRGHASIARSIDQIEMPPMRREELVEILSTRSALLGMHFEEDVAERIAALSQGLPGYTHLLGQAAARDSVERRRMSIDARSLDVGISAALDRADESMTQAWLTATRSAKPTNRYREVLLACALAEHDERGWFTIRSVVDPYSMISGTARSIPNLAPHIAKFTSAERGAILVRDGRPKSYVYRFFEPLVRHYVLLRGVADGLIAQNQLPDR